MAKSIFWTEEKLNILKSDYHKEEHNVLAKRLRCSRKCMTNKAHQGFLKKNIPGLILSLWSEHLPYEINIVIKLLFLQKKPEN